MSDVERIFDRFIDAFADDLLEIARAYIGVEMDRALAVAERSNSKQTKAQLRAQKKSQRLAAKAQLKVDQRRLREAKRSARLADKERVKAERIAEKEVRQVEHDRLKQQRVALKNELEAERRRLREATRKRPVRQLPLDFDGLRAPKSRRGVPAANSPPQLFVHKRKRDGQIEKLARNDGPADPVAPVTNGAAATPPAVPAAPAE
jgi:multidrug efflux pump subunit AcrA (membrane-fusion protein)